MSPREVIRRTIRFQCPDRLPVTFREPYGDDMAWVGMVPSPDARPRSESATDEWGCVWENIGVSSLGEVKEYPLRDWTDWDRLTIPDVRDPKRWKGTEGARERAGDKFLMASGISLYERAHFVRGLQNLWMDIHDAPAELCRLIDILADMNIYAIEQYAALGVDGYFWCDDWGLQKGLMISPDDWRKLWKPRYARVYKAAHDAGMATFLHSCGDIVSILDDLIEAGLDVIQMDQQENMGLDLLGERFGGRITFWCPADIQTVMARGNTEAIRAYCRKMVDILGRPEGGFIAKLYADTVGAGHSQEAVEAMCDEFLRISQLKSSSKACETNGRS